MNLPLTQTLSASGTNISQRSNCAFDGHSAITQLEKIEDYIADDNPVAAYEVVGKIFDQVDTQLTDHPFSGRKGDIPDTRELVISDTPYIVVYEVKEDVVVILRVRHGAQKWPPDDEDFTW